MKLTGISLVSTVVALAIVFPSHVSGGGAVYTRWGKSTCASGSTLIYAGTAAGSHYNHEGGGSNYLCMPSSPNYNEYTTGENTWRALLYTAEYQTHYGPTRLQSRKDHTPTCAVCRAPSSRSSSVMIPARNRCPSSAWRLEYRGYLMAGRYDHAGRTQHVCMDYDMQRATNSATNVNGALFYMVEARCLAGGGLPCGPYVNGRELTCAVCSI